MHVTLIGSTSVDFEAYATLPPQAGTSDADYLGVFAGRACYQSFHRPNSKTAPDADYLASIIEKQHESVLSHASAVFYVTGVSRSLTHELVRHRWLSFSQLSQRYVDESESEYVPSPLVRTDHTADVALWGVHQEAQKAYQLLVDVFTNAGYSIKRAREAARSVLPNATETRLVVSGNLRAWRDFLKQRLSVGADYEIMAFAVEIHRLCKEIAPYSFRDLDDMALVAKSTLP